MTARMKVSTLAFLLLGTLLISCAGYRVGNIQGAQMKDVKSIYVPVVINRTYEPGLPVMATNAILRALDNDGTFSSARSKDADAELNVTITEFQRNPLRSSREDTLITTQYEIILVAVVKLTNFRTGEVVLKDRRISGRAEYIVQADAVEVERQYLPLAAENLGYNIVKQVTEGW
jgi:hypothetical protein